LLPGSSRLPPQRIEKLISQLVEALETVHEQGIYHLDIKPENILISGEGRVVLIDHLINFCYARLTKRLSAIPCMVGSVEVKNPRVLYRYF
jgi:serine/threonine protein kinase